MAIQEEVTTIVQHLPSEVARRKHRNEELKHAALFSSMMEELGGVDEYGRLMAQEIRRIHDPELDPKAGKLRNEWAKLVVNTAALDQKFKEEQRLRLEDMTEDQIVEDLLPICKQIIVQRSELVMDAVSSIIANSPAFRASLLDDVTLLQNACISMVRKDPAFRELMREQIISTIEAEATPLFEEVGE